MCVSRQSPHRNVCHSTQFDIPSIKPKLSTMSVEQCPTQPKGAGCFFSLPLELRRIIYDMVISSQSPRLCPLSYNAGTRTIKQDETHQILETSVDPLCVYDYPELRYVCRDFAHETTESYNAHGWRFSDHTPPTRRYNPDLDILYPAWRGFSQFLGASGGHESPFSVAAVQVRNARRIAMDYSYKRGLNEATHQTLLRVCPHIEQVSVIVTNFGWKETRAGRCGPAPLKSSLDLPTRPCALASAPSFPPPHTEDIKEFIEDYARRYHMKRTSAAAVKEIIEYTKMAGGQIPTLQCSILLKMICPSTAEEGERWEEVAVSA